jgi:hypothetical protein
MKAVSTPLDRSEKPVAGDVGIDALVKEDAVETLQQGSHGTERMRRHGQEFMHHAQALGVAVNAPAVAPPRDAHLDLDVQDLPRMRETTSRSRSPTSVIARPR